MSVLPFTVALEKVTVAVVAGGKVESHTTRASGVRCLITQQAPDGDHGQTHTVTFPTQGTAATEVGVGDRVSVTAGPGYSTGKTLEVLGISRHGGVGGIDAFTRLACREVLESATPARR